MPYRRFLPLCVLLLLTLNFIPAAQAAESSFVLQYPVATRPAQIVQKFVKPEPGKTPHEGVDLAAPGGANVRAGAAGKVKKVILGEDGHGLGAYVQIVTQHEGIKYKVTYGSLKNIPVTVGQQVDVGTLIGKSENGVVKIIIQASQGGLSGFQVPRIVSPKPILRLDGLRLRPIDNNLRLRSAPDTDAPILGQVSQWDLLTTPENAYKAMVKAGKESKWLRVQMENGAIAYASAYYLKTVSIHDPAEGIPGIPIRGMNLDLYQPLGTPAPAPLANLGWVRINYNVSYNPVTGTYGNTDLNAAYARYYPLIKQYAASGNKVIIVLTHQFYGEGQGYIWEQMNPALWQELTLKYANMAGQVAAQYANEKLIYAFQIWNEQDTPPADARAAVPVPAPEYASMLAQSTLAIRFNDQRVRVITGGHISGNVAGTSYASTVLNLLPGGVEPDGIAFHPYGVGPAGSPFNIFGIIDDSIKAWSGVQPNTPLWITEWGVLDYQHDEGIAGQVNDHANGFMQVIEQKFPGMIAASAWYAWAEGMDNGYGLVNDQNQPRQPLYNSFLGNVPVPGAPLVLPQGGLIPLP
jgi:hypothetical protein